MNRSHSIFRLLLIEDDDDLRGELAALFNADGRLMVVGEADSYEIAVELISEAAFDIVLIDLQLGQRSALGLIEAASQNGKVVVYSISNDTDAVVRSLASGADGYLDKGAPAVDMATTLVDVMRGHVPISPTVAGHLLEKVRYVDRAPIKPNEHLHLK